MSAQALPQRSPIEILNARIPKTPPVKVEEIAADMGLRISKRALGPNVAGMIIKDRLSSAGFTIYINGDDNVRRQRFTLAHEIAHYVLHRDLIGDGITDNAMYRSSLSDAYERQANRMAADILMPTHLVLSYYKTVTPALAPLADAFDVSVDAMRIRLQEIGVGP